MEKQLSSILCYFKKDSDDLRMVHGKKSMTILHSLKWETLSRKKQDSDPELKELAKKKRDQAKKIVFKN